MNLLTFYSSWPLIAVLAFVRYKNPTPNPLPANKEGAMIYLI
jgi:hypothetical protein